MENIFHPLPCRPAQDLLQAAVDQCCIHPDTQAFSLSPLLKRAVLIFPDTTSMAACTLLDGMSNVEIDTKELSLIVVLSDVQLLEACTSYGAHLWFDEEVLEYQNTLKQKSPSVRKGNIWVKDFVQLFIQPNCFQR